MCIGLPQRFVLLCLPDGYARFDAATFGGIAGGQHNAVPSPFCSHYNSTLYCFNRLLLFFLLNFIL
jgi:hypothetical protein